MIRMSLNNKFIEVIIPLPIPRIFTYAAASDEEIHIGSRVKVAFGPKRHYCGVVSKVDAQPKEGIKIKEIEHIVDSKPIVTENQIKFWRWIASYYCCTIGEVMKVALPEVLRSTENTILTTKYTYIKLIKTVETPQFHFGRAKKQYSLYMTLLEKGLEIKIAQNTIKELGFSSTDINNLIKKGFIERTVEQNSDLYNQEQNQFIESGNNINKLNIYQEVAYKQIIDSFTNHNTTLLHGVTSSGKTEVYIHLINNLISGDQQALYLLPEIALTTQIIDRLKKAFGQQIGVYHSRMSKRERAEVWRGVIESKIKIVVGARSSIFLPFNNLKLAIVDEEHDGSFKQQSPAPRYNARDCTIILQKLFSAKVVLGTATPSFESYSNALTGKYGYVELTKRHKNIQLPKIIIADLKENRRKKVMKGYLTVELFNEMSSVLEKGKQVILFQNRRGYSSYIECKECGWIPSCKHCDVTLTYHKNENRLKCHYCGFATYKPKACAICGSLSVDNIGVGTQRLEDEILDLFPGKTVSRMDLDTTRAKGSYERLIDQFSSGAVDILIGTQMVTKGLDFENVQVVGVIDADSIINSHNFRAQEQAYQMLSQVSGRAGRSKEQGVVVIQSATPDNKILSHVVNSSYKDLFQTLKIDRDLFHYPPYSRIIAIAVKDPSITVVDKISSSMAAALLSIIPNGILGPAYPSIKKINKLIEKNIWIKLNKDSKIDLYKQKIKSIASQAKKRYGTSKTAIAIDVDPI